MIAWLGRAGLEIKDVAQPARVALTGRTATPGLFEVIARARQGRVARAARSRASRWSPRRAPDRHAPITLACLWALAPGAFPAPAALDAEPLAGDDAGQSALPDRGVPRPSRRCSGSSSASTWRELDVAAHEHQRKTLAEGTYDYRPAVLFVITALVLTLQEYYGGRDFYDEHIRRGSARSRSISSSTPAASGSLVNLQKYDELYGYGWWAFTRVFGYVAFPFVVWKIFFRRDSLLDMGLRIRGFFKPRVDLRALPRRGAAGDVHRLRIAGLRQLLPVLQAGLALLVRLPLLGGDVLRAVLRARDVLPRLLALGAAQQPRLGGHLRDVRALLHDPLRQALPRGRRARSSPASRSARSR